MPSWPELRAHAAATVILAIVAITAAATAAMGAVNVVLARPPSTSSGEQVEVKRQRVAPQDLHRCRPLFAVLDPIYRQIALHQVKLQQDRWQLTCSIINSSAACVCLSPSGCSHFALADFVPITKVI